MTHLLKLFLILGIILPSVAFGMENHTEGLANDPKFQKIIAANNHDGIGDGSGAPSLQVSVSVPCNETESSYAANALGKLDDAITDRFASHAERSTPKAPKANIKDKGIGCTDAVEEDDWSDDIDEFDSPTATPTETPNSQQVDIATVWNAKLEDPAPEAPPFPDSINDNNNNPAQSNPVESPRPLPNEPESSDSGHQIPEEYADAPAPAAPARRPLPPAPNTQPANNSNHAKYIDEEPTIEEIPEPIDEPAEDQESIRARLTPQQREETDFTLEREQVTGGVREERNRTIPQAQRNVRFAEQDRVKPFNPRNPANQVNELDSIIAPAKPGANTAPGSKAQPTNPNLDSTPKSATGFNAINLLISAGIFGIFSWLENNMAKEGSNSFKAALAKEFVTGAQQAAGANIVQQLVCKKPANSFAFTATFAILHGCEVGLKKLTISALRKTKAGKKINDAYNKLPKNKRKILDGVGMLTAWTLKTLLANAIAN